MHLDANEESRVPEQFSTTIFLKKGAARISLTLYTWFMNFWTSALVLLTSIWESTPADFTV